MNIVIHRGTHQIGGCITEISTDKTRIFIDMGSELPDENGDQQEETLLVDGVTQGNRACDAVFFTHYHGDHIGGLSEILDGVPLYMGEAGKAIYLILQNRLRNGNPKQVERINTFIAGEKIVINDIAITPYWVDHSAYDAYMFLIEADGKRILHTGDFRNHGFRGKGLLPMMKHYVGQVDVLITEGTQLSRNPFGTMTEQALQLKAKKLLKDYKYVFVSCSSTNIDRIAAFYAATPRGRYFLCDYYQLDVIKMARKYAGVHSSLYQFEKAMTLGNNLKSSMEKRGFCMLVRSGNQFKNTMAYYKENHPDETLIIYSMWEGYLKQKNNPLGAMLEGFKNIEYLHTSGHATRQAIIDVCNTTAPRIGIIPIHSEKPEILDGLALVFPIIHLNDGEKYAV